jgi:glucose-1-phosphate thymidylyltransferase
MDCGNKNVTVETNSRMLGFASRWTVSKTLKSENSTIIAPCFIDDDVVLINATVVQISLEKVVMW